MSGIHFFFKVLFLISQINQESASVLLRDLHVAERKVIFLSVVRCLTSVENCPVAGWVAAELMEKKDSQANSRHVRTAHSPFSLTPFLLSPSLHVDLRPAITWRCDIKSLTCCQWRQHSVLSFSHPSLFISCSQAENKRSHQALGRHRHLFVSARLKNKRHPLCEQLHCTAVGAPRWHCVVLCERMSRESSG